MTNSTNATDFESRYGFRRADVRLGNWRTAPFNRWSFQNVSEMVSSALISGPASAERDLGAGGFLSRPLDLGGTRETIAAFLERSATDALVVMKAGRFIHDFAAPTTDLSAPHIAFSVSKSLTAILAGTLVDEGRLDPSSLVSRYVAETEGSAFADATVQQLLDMRVSLDFDESYLDPIGSFARYRRATMWNPGGGEETLLEFIVTLGRTEKPHGGAFRYRSPNSDLLGVIVERASGKRFAELFRQRIWTPLGCTGNAFITVDGQGTPRTAGGISITARDLARVGEMMRNGGIAPGGRVLSQAWVRDTLTGGDKDAWKAGDFAKLTPNGSYRNKWYATGAESRSFFAVGIHGQWLYVDPSREVVIVKMSSQAEPVDDPLDAQCLAVFDEMARIA